jgi:hypothetical protein
MRVIDAFTGREVMIGDTVPSPGGEHDWELLDVEDRWTTARARIREVESGRTRWSPLVVRFMHPGFLFQRVAFVPS